MAEASLDDFFAKKDKKGKKSKSKLTPSELLAKQDAEIKPAKKKKEKDKSQSRQTQSSTTSGSSSVVDEDGQEWNEVHEESEKDYTGLRIQNLQISKEEEEEESDRRESDEEGGGEDGKERREAREGPWNKGGQPSQPESAPQPPPDPEPTPKPEEPKATGKYVPPSARYAATASATSNISQMRKKKGAPNIRSEEDFPTLGGGAPGGGGVRWGAPEHGDRSFERVRGGNKQMDDPSSKNLSLTLGNKFQALKQE